MKKKIFEDTEIYGNLSLKSTGGGDCLFTVNSFNKPCFHDGNEMNGLAYYPVGAIYMSTNSTSPASLFGGAWTKIEDYLGTPVVYKETSGGYKNVLGSQDVTLVTLTIPANARGIVTGTVEANASDGNAIMNAKLMSEGRELLITRTTMSNGGGCSVSYAIETGSSATNIILSTYGYRSETTPIRGTLTALLFEPKSAWQRTA